MVSVFAGIQYCALLDNILLSCVNTIREDGAEKAPCSDIVAAAGVGAARLTVTL